MTPRYVPGKTTPSGESSARKTAPRSKLAFAGWLLLAFFAVVNDIAGLRYGLPHIPFPTNLPNLVTHRGWLVAHAVWSSVALLAGPWQFSTRLRVRAVGVHRWLGRIYCGSVCAGWITSLPIAVHAQTGIVASAGFLTLGALWFLTTAAGYRTIRLGNVRVHRAWMIRSYALTAAAITLRMYLPVLIVTHTFARGYGVVAWICWIPNLLFAEWLLRRTGAKTAPQPRPTALPVSPA